MLTREELLILAVLAYMAGSLPFGWWIGLRLGKDLRKLGSGNIGATNADRVLGKPWGTVTLLLDILKMMTPVLILRVIFHDSSLAALLGCCVLLGHCYSIILGLDGGKGVASTLGLALAISPWSALAALLISKLVKKVTRYVSVSSMAGVACLAVMTFLTHQPLAIKQAFTFAALLVIFRHASNIKRLLQGTEPKMFKPEITGTFTVNAPDDDPAYYRAKLGKKFLPFIPYAWLEHWISDEMIEWLKGHVKSIGMGKVTGIVSQKNGRCAEMKFKATTMSAATLKADEAAGCAAVLKMVVEAARKKIKFFGLGGFTSIITEGGTKVAEAIREFGAYVTSGNSLTAFSNCWTVKTMAEDLGYELSKCTVTIIGGGGSIGKALARILARFFGRIILVGRPGVPLDAVVAEIGLPNVTWDPSLQVAMSRSKFVVSVASVTEEMDIDPSWFLSGTVVVDACRPRSMGDKLALRPDILVVAGGIWVLPPGAYSTFDFGLHPREVLACMAETIVLMLEGWVHQNSSLGRDLDPDFCMKVGQWAFEHGFTTARLRSTDDKPISARRLITFFRLAGFSKEQYRPVVWQFTRLPE